MRHIPQAVAHSVHFFPENKEDGESSEQAWSLLVFIFCVPSSSVVSDSLGPCGLQPARLLCPGDSPGKNTGVGCHFLFQGSFPAQDGTCVCCTGRWILYHLSHLGSLCTFQRGNDVRNKVLSFALDCLPLFFFSKQTGVMNLEFVTKLKRSTDANYQFKLVPWSLEWHCYCFHPGLQSCTWRAAASPLQHQSPAGVL